MTESIITSAQGLAVAAAWSAFARHARTRCTECAAVTWLVERGEFLPTPELWAMACEVGKPLLQQWIAAMDAYMGAVYQRMGKMRRSA